MVAAVSSLAALPVLTNGIVAVRIGMMQPYFFPYPGYFSLIQATDRWVIFDTAQYIRRGWVNRNRVLSTGNSIWKYMRVPVRHTNPDTPISQVSVDNRQDWQRKLVDGLDFYRLRRAPHYRATIEFIEDTISLQTEQLSDLVRHCLLQCCQYLSIPIHWSNHSETSPGNADANKPGDWAFLTTQSLGGTAYINAPGGRHLFDSAQFRRAGIELLFLEPVQPRYEQSRQHFEPDLSIIDVLMWNDVSAVRQMIGEYNLRAA